MPAAQTLTRPEDFPAIERRTQSEGCPAAQLAMTSHAGIGVVCGVIEAENRRRREEVREHVPASLTEAHDPSSIHGYCTTRGFKNCPVWRSEQARKAKRADTIDAADANYGDFPVNRL